MPQKSYTDRLSSGDNRKHYISWVEGRYAENSNGFSYFSPGVFVLDWVETDIVDMGFAAVTRETARGSLVVEIEAKKVYAIGIRDEGNVVEIWGVEGGVKISHECLNPAACEQLKQQLLKN